MLSERQLAANRANALKSTGPKTPEGKEAVRANALRHGIYSQQVFIKTEQQDAFHDLYQALLDEHQPVGPTETGLIYDIALTRFRLLRMHTIEAGFFDMRLEQTASEAHGFRDRVTDPIHLALAFYSYHTITFNSLSRHEARLHREFLRL